MKEEAQLLVYVIGKGKQRNVAKEFVAQASELLRNKLEDINQGWVVSNAVDITSLFGAMNAMTKSRHYMISIAGGHFTEEMGAYYGCKSTLEYLESEFRKCKGVKKTKDFAVRLMCSTPERLDDRRLLGVMKVEQPHNI